MQNLVTALNKVFSWLARRLMREPEIYCFECGRYRKMLGITRHPNYRILEYNLECGHIIWEKAEKEYWRALDNFLRQNYRKIKITLISKSQ